MSIGIRYFAFKGGQLVADETYRPWSRFKSHKALQIKLFFSFSNSYEFQTNSRLSPTQPVFLI